MRINLSTDEVILPGANAGTTTVQDFENVRGGIGGDTITGDSGRNKLQGRNGNDEIKGGSKRDRIDGGNGSDTLSGEAGNDVIKGGKGDDTLTGGNGTDVLVGGAGADRFVFGAERTSLANPDQIIGFDIEENDSILLVGTRDDYVFTQDFSGNLVIRNDDLNIHVVISNPNDLDFADLMIDFTE